MAKRKVLYVFAVVALAIFMAECALANMFYSASKNEEGCSIHGDINLELRTIGTLDTTRLTVEAKHYLESSYSEIEVQWYDKNDDLMSAIPSDTMVTLRSLDSYFNKQGEYSIIFNYKGAYEELKVNCPEFKFSCNNIKIDIQECYTEGDNFVIVFLGKGLESQKTKLNLEKDLYYKIESQRQNWISDTLPKNISFEKLENETYKMTFPRNKEYPAKSNLLSIVEIGVKEDIETIPYLSSGCNGGQNNRIYPNSRDTESKCPTKVEMIPSDIVTPDKTEEIDEKDNNIGITGKIIKGDEGMQNSSLAPMIIAGIIGFIVGIAITFMWTDKKK